MNLEPPRVSRDETPSPIDSVRERPARIWTVVAAYGILLLGTLVGGIALSFVAGVQLSLASIPLNEETLTEVMQTPGFLLSSVGLIALLGLGLATAGAHLSVVPFSQRLRIQPSHFPRPTLVHLLGIAGCLAVSQMLSSIISLLELESPSIEWMLVALAESDTAELLGIVVVAGGLAPLAEELFFRGYVQTRFSRRWGAKVSVVLASFLFGLLHLDPVHSFFALLIGLYLGWLTEITGSIRTSLFGHVANNAVWVIVAKFYPEELSVSTHWALVSASLLILVLTIALIRRNAPHIAPLPEREPSQNPPNENGENTDHGQH
jgi:membrane protease YdiL (CAAX protease family)